MGVAVATGSHGCRPDAYKLAYQLQDSRVQGCTGPVKVDLQLIGFGWNKLNRHVYDLEILSFQLQLVMLRAIFQVDRFPDFLRSRI